MWKANLGRVGKRHGFLLFCEVRVIFLVLQLHSLLVANPEAAVAAYGQDCYYQANAGEGFEPEQCRKQ